MIRANPTAIPLRTSDLKLLQAEIEKRKATSTEPTSDPQSTQPSTSTGNAEPKEGHNAVEEQKKERQGRTKAERIGL